MNTELANNVNWVGYVDWPVRDFHGYQTKRGSSYNAYLVRGAQKTALIDTVKAPYADALLDNVRALCPLEQVDVIVCNHAEPDHSGALPAVVRACPNAVVVCNAKCQDALSRHYDTSAWRFQVVKEGETLDLGGRTLQFFDTVMCHWPESMVTYLVEEEILFSMDCFGQHYATYRRFDDEADMNEVMQEAKTYYANIVLPYAQPVGAPTSTGSSRLTSTGTSASPPPRSSSSTPPCGNPPAAWPRPSSRAPTNPTSASSSSTSSPSATPS